MPLQHPFIALVLHTVISSIDAFSAVSSDSSKPLRWLVVGGGPHGVHVATRLLDEVPFISSSDIQIVDDGPRLLHKWKSRTEATGMGYLRSSASYHLDVKEDGLKRYAKHVVSGKKSTENDQIFAADYQRPKLDFFNQHCDHVIAKNHLDEVHLQGLVTDIIPKESHVEVEIQQPNGDIVTSYAENIVLALGSDAPANPDWVTDEMTQTGKVRHIFDDARNETCSCGQSIAIIGGGISAAHLALKFTRENAHNNIEEDDIQTNIHMICRHEIREKQFDTHQDWMMDSFAARRSEAGGGQGIPKCQRHFAGLDSYVERRNLIKRERQAGTISPSVNRGAGGLRYAIDGESIHWHQGEIQGVSQDESTDKLRISMIAGEELHVDQIILATGFGTSPPCADLMNRIAARNDLKICQCGYPAPDESLRWHSRIFLSGALAELELGPSARNLAGARLASERIVAAARFDKAQQSIKSRQSIASRC